MELELFTDIHSVAPGPEPSADSPRTKACRLCAAEIFLWGLKEWWVRERQKGCLEQSVMNRKDCPDASRCVRQKNDLGVFCPIATNFMTLNVLFIPFSQLMLKNVRFKRMGLCVTM